MKDALQSPHIGVRYGMQFSEFHAGVVIYAIGVIAV